MEAGKGDGGMDAPVGDVPENANESCPGTESDAAGKASACDGCPNQQICATAPKGPDPDLGAISARMEKIKHKILVLSGKGGVGKSTFSSQLAFALAARDKQVGLLDVDICGPSIPRMLGLQGEEIHQSAHGWSPVFVDENLGVMSIGFLLPNPDEAVVWRGPRKNGLIKQFLKDVNWGELDYLVVDSPPGTSDEHISLAQYLKATNIDGAIMLTTPQEVSLMDVRKELNFCKKVGIPVLGVVENMSQMQVPLSSLRFHSDGAAVSNSRETEPGTSREAENGTSSGENGSSETSSTRDVTREVMEVLQKAAPHLLNGGVTACIDLFPKGGGGEGMAGDMGVPFLGRIPLDPALSQAAEEGRACLVTSVGGSSPSARALASIIEVIVRKVEKTTEQPKAV